MVAFLRVRADMSISILIVLIILILIVIDSKTPIVNICTEEAQQQMHPDQCFLTVVLMIVVGLAANRAHHYPPLLPASVR